MAPNGIYNFLSFHFSLIQDLPSTCRSFSYKMPIFNASVQLSVGGIVVSIAAFQAVDPGSIPGHRSNTILTKATLKVKDHKFTKISIFAYKSPDADKRLL